LGKLPGGGIVRHGHGLGGGLSLGAGFSAGIENDMNLAVEIDRLRPLSAVVEHLDLSVFTEGQRNFGGHAVKWEEEQANRE
jgi:hypothetical protein